MCRVHIGWRVGTKIRLLVPHTILYHHFPIQCITHSPTSSSPITVPLTPFIPFPKGNATMPSMHTLPHSSNLYPIPAIWLTSSVSTHQSLSNFPHITNKCSISFPAPLSHITYLSSQIFYIPSYPPTTQLSQSSAWTSTSHLSGTAQILHTSPNLHHFFGNLYYFNVL